MSRQLTDPVTKNICEMYINHASSLKRDKPNWYVECQKPKIIFSFGKWFNGRHVQVQNKESGNPESSNKSQSIDRD
jgi:hypothetical protein